jgi:hypothetical protein
MAKVYFHDVPNCSGVLDDEGICILCDKEVPSEDTGWFTKAEDPFKKKFTKEQVDAFLNDIFAVYEKHGLSLAHEDGNGGFLIEENDEQNRDWLRHAIYEEME